MYQIHVFSFLKTIVCTLMYCAGKIQKKYFVLFVKYLLMYNYAINYFISPERIDFKSVLKKLTLYKKTFFTNKILYPYTYLTEIYSFLPSFLPSFLHSFLSTFLPSFLHSLLPSFLPSFLPFFLPSLLPSSLPPFLPSCPPSPSSPPLLPHSPIPPFKQSDVNKIPDYQKIVVRLLKDLVHGQKDRQIDRFIDRFILIAQLMDLQIDYNIH